MWRFAPLDASKTDVYVVIPTYNEEHLITDTLVALSKQTYQGDIWVTVVDDASTDNTIASVEAFCADNPKVRVELIKRLVNSGMKAQPMNEGVERAVKRSASDDIIMILDSDTVLEKHAVQASVAYMQHNPDKDGACGLLMIKDDHRRYPKKRLPHFLDLEYLTLKGQYLEHKSTIHASKSMLGDGGTVTVMSGAMNVMRPRAMTMTGFFGKDHLVEDACWTWKAKSKGLNLGYINDATGFTAAQPTFDSTIKQRIRWGHGIVEAYKNLDNSNPQMKRLCFMMILVQIYGAILMAVGWSLLLTSPLTWLFYVVVVVVDSNLLSRYAVLDILRLSDPKTQDMSVIDTLFLAFFQPIFTMAGIWGLLQEIFSRGREWGTR